MGIDMGLGPITSLQSDTPVVDPIWHLVTVLIPN
jgi:hypothetical protein